MNRIAEEVESDPTYPRHHQGAARRAGATGADAIAAAARQIAETLDLSAIVCWTFSGSTGLRVARERPRRRSSRSRRTSHRRAGCRWSGACIAWSREDARDQDDMVERACRIAFADGFAKAGAASSSSPACRSARRARPTCCERARGAGAGRGTVRLSPAAP
jgi:pyruvate kinase